MSCFPMCVELKGQRILLVGAGEQIAAKMEKLRPFGAELVWVDSLREEMLCSRPIFVVIGDVSETEAYRSWKLCENNGVPVNVVDRPELCSFFFPALCSRGELTIAVSTGGNSPGTAVWLRDRIARELPDRTEEILDWLTEVRQKLKGLHPIETYRKILKDITEKAFALQRPLTEEECNALLEGLQ